MMRSDTVYTRSILVGWLLIRLGFGIMFILHGAPKVLGGPDKWEQIGSTMDMLGISFGHTAFGMLAGLAEFAGGICLILGLFTRPAAALLLVTMLVATSRHVLQDDPFSAISHPIEAGIVFLGFLIGGAGPMSLDHRLFRKVE